MSFRIPCPHCGLRPLTEFHYGGELPCVPDDVTDPDARNVDWVWMRTNPAGPCTERWFHELGCRRWVTIVRDTRTNELL